MPTPGPSGPLAIAVVRTWMWIFLRCILRAEGNAGPSQNCGLWCRPEFIEEFSIGTDLYSQSRAISLSVWSVEIRIEGANNISFADNSRLKNNHILGITNWYM